MPYVPGDNWIICDISGRKVLMSQSKKTWDGLRVHPDYWYPRHPQLDVKAVPDDQKVVDGRGRTEDYFLDANEVAVEDLVGNLNTTISDPAED